APEGFRKATKDLPTERRPRVEKEGACASSRRRAPRGTGSQAKAGGNEARGGWKRPPQSGTAQSTHTNAGAEALRAAAGSADVKADAGAGSEWAGAAVRAGESRDSGEGARAGNWRDRGVDACSLGNIGPGIGFKIPGAGRGGK